MLPTRFLHGTCRALVLVIAILSIANAAEITWSSKLATGDTTVSNRGSLLEAANFGNVNTTAPTVNGVHFTGVDFTSGASPANLVGLTYNTGESGHLAGSGANQLHDTLAYRSGADPQTAELIGLTVGNDYEVQFFYHHRTVNRTLTIADATGNRITLSDTGQPLVATGTFTADATTQPLTFDANTGSQFLNAYQLREITPDPPLVLDQILISEILASNDNGLTDNDGHHHDWIEIWNSTTTPVNLDGWFLSNDPNTPTLWRLPDHTLAPDEFLIVFASGNPTSDRHTNFTLEKSTGHLALHRPDATIAHQHTYPAQKTDIAYGLHGTAAPLATGYLESPTPGARNSQNGFNGFVADTKFDPDRGFYDTPLHVTITTTTAGATVRYTTDGSLPAPDNGTDYPGGPGIPVGRTTIIRAAAFKDGFKPTDVDTHTYLFVADVVEQPSDPPGVPTTWTGADYAMENNPAHLPLVAGDTSLSPAAAKQVIADALRDLPALSLTMPADDWFDRTSGIYHNTGGRGMAWERACSAEYFFTGENPAGPGFQIDCGVRVQGFTSRDPNRNPKHSLRLAFRGRYGASKLRYPLFGDSGPSSFDTVVLRSNSQDAWVYNSSANRAGQFVRDHWNRRVMQLMGQPAPHSNWVHLYLNGLYWGVYNPTERPDAAFSATVHGGDKDNYDAIKNHEEAIDGTITAYREALALIQNNPSNFTAGYRDLSAPADYAATLPFIETTNLADYMIHNMYSAAQDWPGNFYMGYDRTSAHGGWWFYDWDNEHGLKGSVTENRTRPHSRDADSPTKFHHALRANPDYRLLFADRLHRAFFDGGPLAVDPDNPAWDPGHPERNRPAALWMQLTSEIETALIAESARWGDYRRATPYTVARDFTTLRDSLLRSWFPRRSAIVLDQFRAMGLYPDTPAPTFDLPDGTVPTGTPLTITAPPGTTVRYTLDATDPRTSPSAITYTTPIALQISGQINARSLDAGDWSALTQRSFIVGTPASAANLAISEIMYHATAGSTHDFIELTNISPTETIELTTVHFTAGITYQFPTATTLAPASHLVLAKTPSLYPGSLGPFTGNLDNAGESLTLTAHDGTTIRSFRYNDNAPWPTTPDGTGPSLVLIAPHTNPDHARPENWRPSTTDGGNPATSDTVPFNPATDDLLSYALGPAPDITATRSGTLTFSPSPGSDAAAITPQWSTDLQSWSTTGFSLSAQDPTTYHLTQPTTVGKVYFRLLVETRP